MGMNMDDLAAQISETEQMKNDLYQALDERDEMREAYYRMVMVNNDILLTHNDFLMDLFRKGMESGDDD